MNIVNTYEAKSKLSQLINSVQDGSEIVIAKAGTPLAVLSAYKEKKIIRKPGVLEGKIWMAEDFDETPDVFNEYIK